MVYGLLDSSIYTIQVWRVSVGNTIVWQLKFSENHDLPSLIYIRTKTTF